MKTQFRLCFSRLAASFLLLLSLLSNTSMAGPIEDARAAADNSGIQALGLYGTKSGSNSNISVPMTSPSTQLNTVDNSESFTANLTSPSSSKFLEMLIQPAPTGDLQQVIIAQDLNTDNVFDNTFAIPRMVSGVCANGYISCAQGTWSNCVPYQWVSDATGRIGEVVVPIMSLGGCYCINNSCGSNLVWSNSSIVLKDLAGGVLGAIQNANINFTITNVSYTPVSIDYYGNVTGNSPTAVSSLNNVVSTPPVTTLQSYFSDVTLMSNEINGSVPSQSLIPTSLYSQVSAVPLSGNRASCVVNRSTGLTNLQNFCNEPPFPNQINELLTNSYVKMDTGTRRGNNNCQCYWTLIQDGIGCAVFTAPTVTVLPAGVVDTGVVSADDFFDGYSSSYDLEPCSYHVYRYYSLCVRSAVALSESIDNQCATLESSPNCSLDSEVIDGVQVLSNGGALGITPLPTCKDYPSPGGTIHLCRPWWNQSRTYLCHNTQTWGFDDMRTRYNTVVGSVTQSGSYSDQIKGTSGTWTTSTGSATVPTPPAVAECEPSCKTGSVTGTTQVLVNGLIQSRSDPATAGNFTYKLCVNGVCPLEPGEVIIDNCQCLSDFNQASMAIQSIRMGSKDMICTSGQRRALQ